MTFAWASDVPDDPTGSAVAEFRRPRHPTRRSARVKVALGSRSLPGSRPLPRARSRLSEIDQLGYATASSSDHICPLEEPAARLAAENRHEHAIRLDPDTPEHS
jgi:hypothetical protein